MLEWKTIHIEGRNFIGMYIVLPKQKIYIIISTKCILVGNMFDIHTLSPDCNVFIMQRSNSYLDLIESRVMDMNDTAKENGYINTMYGKEVLLYQNQKKK